MGKKLYKAFLILAVSALFILAYLIILDLILTKRNPTLDLQRHVLPAAEKVKHDNLLIKHGLQDGRTLIEDWPSKPWFLRDGKRCSFQ
ncbi:MAG: hypothetical protein NT047_00725 [Deltaproteobacteria bacterium]|nr:hypothetical protein [Deltaproteobacteria bacterium]